MATFDDWLNAYSDAYDGDPSVACPHCGHRTLRTVYTADPDRDVGNAAFWCDTCLQGISISRAIVPDGAAVRDRSLPSEERLPKIPNFTLVW